MAREDEPRALTPQAFGVIVLRAVDGDSVAVGIDKGVGDWDFGADNRGLSLRLHGANCRELNAPGGREARAETARLLGCGVALPGSLPFPLRATHRATVVAVDKYGGRLLARVALADGRDLAGVLIATDWAAPYTGDGAPPLPPWPRTDPLEAA